MKNVTDHNEVNLNGMRVIARTKDAIYLRIPKALQMTSQFISPDNKCSCGHCDGNGTWDTLVVPANDNPHDWASTVHMPDSAIPAFLLFIKKNETPIKKNN